MTRRRGTVCAGAAGDTTTAVLMSRRVDETADGWWQSAERDMVGRFVMDRKRSVAEALRRMTGAADDGCGQRCRLIVYEMLYVKYGAAKWPADSLHAVLAGKSPKWNVTTTPVVRPWLRFWSSNPPLGRYFSFQVYCYTQLRNKTLLFWTSDTTIHG